ncbi:MAG: hypothetical protein HEEMFOPI_01986 [Holosporales bacterium]
MEQKAPSFIPKSKNREDDFISWMPVTKEDLLKDVDDDSSNDLKIKEFDISMEEIINL